MQPAICRSPAQPEYSAPALRLQSGSSAKTLPFLRTALPFGCLYLIVLGDKQIGITEILLYIAGLVILFGLINDPQ
ncbi:DUF6903 family protein [Halopseudomonas bauzanensis]|uniref:DUF6903 family protein n=1 Tax=Halopseudomonas bauzanensis TaxID=653930 RepID=UPI00352592D7